MNTNTLLTKVVLSVVSPGFTMRIHACCGSSLVTSPNQWQHDASLPSTGSSDLLTLLAICVSTLISMSCVGKNSRALGCTYGSHDATSLLVSSEDRLSNVSTTRLEGLGCETAERVTVLGSDADLPDERPNQLLSGISEQKRQSKTMKTRKIGIGSELEMISIERNIRKVN